MGGTSEPERVGSIVLMKDTALYARRAVYSPFWGRTGRQDVYDEGTGKFGAGCKRAPAAVDRLWSRHLEVEQATGLDLDLGGP